jgi:protein-disulfide isomerase
MHKGTMFVIVTGAVIGGVALGVYFKKEGGDEAKPKVAAVAPTKPGALPPGFGQRPPTPLPTDVYKIPLGAAPVKGAKAPKVTIVEYSEFQCPFCGRVAPTIKQIEDTYKDDVAIAFKHLPLPFHNNAEGAAIAAIAADEQGKFWQMHDKLFANQTALDRPNLEKYAQEIGLDMAKFKATLDNPAKAKERIAEDSKQAANFGATGTPTFFINGRKLVGAQPFNSFQAAIDEEVKKADAKLKEGVARADLYAALTKGGLDKAAAPPAQPARPAEANGDTVYKAEIGDAPVRGAKDALVTIVQYSDFQCPFCSRVEPTMDKLLEDYKGKIRIAWHDFPLSFHPNAMPAAIVARVANESGKFWEMHKKLFEHQTTLDRANLETYAGEVGLNVAKVKAALDSKKYEKEINADIAAGSKIGVQGTPASFVNGIFVSGARPYEMFKAEVDKQLAKAEELVKKGVKKHKLYDEIMKGAATQVAAAPAAAKGADAPEPTPESDQTVFKVDPGKSFARGPKSAPITLVLYSDFQCPFCGRVEPSITQLEKDFPGKIRVVWKDYPLPFHPNARPAAIAARVAGEQGKFWEMHNKLFQNQQALDRPNLEKYAAEVGIDVGKLKAALDSNKYSSEIEADLKSGQELGVNGTPASFINGRKIGGAYPYETFKKVVEQELAKPKKRS